MLCSFFFFKFRFSFSLPVFSNPIRFFFYILFLAGERKNGNFWCVEGIYLLGFGFCFGWKPKSGLKKQNPNQPQKKRAPPIAEGNCVLIFFSLNIFFNIFLMIHCIFTRQRAPLRGHVRNSQTLIDIQRSYTWTNKLNCMI